MSCVRQITLFLNMTVPLYFFYYQLVIQRNDTNKIPQQQQPNFLILLLRSSLVFISPILHILALVNKPYCYKGHCSVPFHCRNVDQNVCNKQNNYQNKWKDNQFRFNQNKYKSKFSDPKEQNKEQFDIIKESTVLSNQFLNQHFYNKYNEPKQYPYLKIKEQTPINNSGLILKLQKIQSPSNFYQQQNEQQKQKKEEQQTLNINQFSNISFFRTSRKSLSNIGNNESPRKSKNSPRASITRKSNNQSKLVQPLIKLTPRKLNTIEEINNKYNLIQQSNKKKIISSNISSQYTQIFPYYILQCEYCQDCLIPKYLRMKHCYRCNKCVHKYDHHCVLLNICIGQNNQKYYIAFLYAHLYNLVLALKFLFVWIHNDVYIDQITGIQHINVYYTIKAVSIIVLLLLFILTTYLIYIHTNFLFNGLTTYQRQRRQTINYFRYMKKNRYNISVLRQLDQQQFQTYHPFDEGCLNNILKVIKAGSKPYDWQLPFKQCNTIIEMKEKKQNAKIKNQQKIYQFLRQWGQQSQSSNNILAGKTTKSRQSFQRKSKQQQTKILHK